MPHSKPATELGRIGAAALLLAALTGCWASKEETDAQLKRHISAYETIEVTPDNARSIVKGIDLLTSKPESNNFRKAMNASQVTALEKIKANAETVVSCTDKLKAFASSSERANMEEVKQMSINTLSSILGPLQETENCTTKANVLSKEEVSKLNSYVKDLSTALKAKEAEEAARIAAEEAAKKAAAEAEKRREAEAIAARESRINRFIARTGMKKIDTGSYDVDRMRKDIDRAMLRALEKNCEDWLPSSCMREYGITIYDFDLVREKLGL